MLKIDELAAAFEVIAEDAENVGITREELESLIFNLGVAADRGKKAGESFKDSLKRLLSKEEEGVNK